MTIYSHSDQTETTFSMVADCFARTKRCGSGVVAQVTPSVNTYLKWIFEDVIREEEAREAREMKMLGIISWWEMGKASSCFNGFFDLEQYRKVLKYEPREAHECKVPKVKLKTIYP